MKLIIDIPERDYLEIKDYNLVFDEFQYEIGRAIAEGTPLPKGHGDLVDRDRVIDLLNEQEYNYYTELDKVADTVYEAEAIIEADESEE